MEDIFATKKIFQNRLENGLLGPKMAVIPAGSFRMGDIQATGDENEKPIHKVSVNSFAMGQYPVTVGEFRQFVESTRYKTDAEKSGGSYMWKQNHWQKLKEANWHNPSFPQQENQPVVCVSWYDAIAYTQWLSEQTGKIYDLPTEAEWEYATRAGTETDYWWGNTIGNTQTNCINSGSQWSGQQTSPVGSFEPNPYGLYDTVGNVWEWIADSWHKNYTNAPHESCSWTENAEKNLRILRGGSWNNEPYFARAAYRLKSHPVGRSLYNGIRVVARTVETVYYFS